ncbi:MAG: T9SS type A sorting domain-containing protein [Bacteroidota bacterium]
MKKNVLFAVAILIMHTASAQWLPQNAGFTNDTLGFYEMSLPDKNTAWAVCYDGKLGLLSGRPVLDFTRTTNGGETWIPGKMGTDRTLRFSNISAINGQEAWVAMNKIAPVPNNLFLSFAKGGGIFHTTDAGLTWEHTDSGQLFNNNSIPRFVHFKDKNHGVAMGDPNGGYFEVYITNNKGKKWKRVQVSKLPAPLTNEIGWISGYAVVGNTIWFGTSMGRMYKSVDFGENWTVHIVDPLPGTYVNEIAFLDDGLTGVAHLRGRSRTFVFSTTDGGLTWTNYFQPANWKNSRMTAVPGTRAFVSTAVHPNPMFQGSAVSYDAGQTWTEIEKDASKAVCRFFDAHTGYAGGFFQTTPFQGGIFKSQIDFQINGDHDNNTQAQNSGGVQDLVSEKRDVADLVKVYPTPARDIINISLEGQLAGTTSVIRIISLDGKVVETRRVKASGLVQIDIHKLAPGMYVLRVESANQTVSKTITVSR